MHHSKEIAENSATASFMRSIGQNFRSTRLGDILLASGVISQPQLDKALDIQKTTKDPLGKILIREGALTAVQLYRKLAEQWCLKASMAGMTLMMQTMTPVMARADDGGVTAQFKLAAAMSPAAVKPSKQSIAYPELFGTTEIRSNDISAFKKWTAVMKKFEDQMVTQSSSPRVQVWKTEIQSLKKLSVRDQVAGVNEYINSVRYIEDNRNYGKSDYWATPIEFFSKGGDCEDFAIAKFASLRALGFSADQMRIAIVQDKIKNIPHAILIVYTEDGTFVLDNQDKRARYAQDVNRYKPIFSINSTNWWLHKA